MAVNTTVQVTMPQMGDSVTEGTILEWHKQEGETVAADETLVEISTDKVDAEVPAPVAGTVVKIHPQVWKHATTPETAAAINLMMQGVVQSGTGTAAQIPGVKVAGKTGTAETAEHNVYTAWFIFFAPADNPTIAGAIAVEHQLNGFGGAVSAPIAKQLMQALLPQASKP